MGGFASGMMGKVWVVCVWIGLEDRGRGSRGGNNFCYEWGERG